MEKQPYQVDSEWKNLGHIDRQSLYERPRRTPAGIGGCVLAPFIHRTTEFLAGRAGSAGLTAAC